MAAVAVATSGRPSKKKSRRALAQSFLSNISLDGNVTGCANASCSDPSTPIREIGEYEEETTSPDHHPALEPFTSTTCKPKYLHSISESAASYEKDKMRTLSVKEMKTRKAPENVFPRRSYSLTESNLTDCSSGGSSSSFSGFLHYGKAASRHKITCMTGSSFRLRRKLNDKRIVICSPHKVPFITYSILKYHKDDREHISEVLGKKRAYSAANNCHTVCIEGVEVGTSDKTVSYSTLLIPSYSIQDQKERCTNFRTSLDSPLDTVHEEFSLMCSASGSSYEPYCLDDPELTSGKHRTVLQLSSYMVSITAYAKPSELKKDLNERFKEKFPHIDITLTKLRSLKKDLLKIAVSPECQLDLTTVAYAYVYFEKLILKGKINQPNRKLVAGSCLLLAAKFNDDKRDKTKDLIDKIEDKLKIQVKELLGFEFQALVGLEFNLHIPQQEVMPHLKRLESEQQ